MNVRLAIYQVWRLCLARGVEVHVKPGLHLSSHGRPADGVFVEQNVVGPHLVEGLLIL